MAGRDTSWWGWGYADAFPVPAARRAIGQMVSGLLGVGGELEPAEPRPLDAIELAPPRFELTGSLAGLGDSSLGERVGHTYGKAYLDILRGFRGDFGPAPDV